MCAREIHLVWLVPTGGSQLQMKRLATFTVQPTQSAGTLNSQNPHRSRYSYTRFMVLLTFKEVPLLVSLSAIRACGTKLG
jgi:hypothetical protein